MTSLKLLPALVHRGRRMSVDPNSGEMFDAEKLRELQRKAVAGIYSDGRRSGESVHRGSTTLRNLDAALDGVALPFDW